MPLGLNNFPPTQPLLCHSRTTHDVQVLLLAGQQCKEVWVAKRLQVLINKYPQVPEQVVSPSEQRPRKHLVEGSMGTKRKRSTDHPPISPSFLKRVTSHDADDPQPGPGSYGEGSCPQSPSLTRLPASLAHMGRYLILG